MSAHLSTQSSSEIHRSFTSPELIKKLGDFALLGAISTPAKKARIRAVLNCLPPLNSKSQCLDIGSAHGGFASLFSKTGNWTFNDIDTNNLLVAKTILKGNFTTEDAVKYLQKRTEPLDLVVCIGTIIYFEDPDSLLSAIHLRLDQKGNLLITGREANSDNPIIKLRHILGIEEALGAVRYMNSGQMRNALSKAGFEVIMEERYLGFFTHCLQTMIDYFSLGAGKGKNKLTYQLDSLDEKSLRRKTLFCYVSRVLSTCTLFLDKLFYFLPKDNFVFLVNKKKGLPNGNAQ